MSLQVCHTYRGDANEVCHTYPGDASESVAHLASDAKEVVGGEVDRSIGVPHLPRRCERGVAHLTSDEPYRSAKKK
jgi:hypothetical protein